MPRRMDNRVLELGDTRRLNGERCRVIGIWEDAKEVKLVRWGYDPEEDDAIVTVPREVAADAELLWRFEEQPMEEETGTSEQES